MFVQVTNPAGAEEVTFEVWLSKYRRIDILYVKVWDKDTISPDDFIGRVRGWF